MFTDSENICHGLKKLYFQKVYIFPWVEKIYVHGFKKIQIFEKVGTENVRILKLFKF
jgi:hypothetical protein